MLQGHHFFKFLPLIALCIYIQPGSAGINAKGRGYIRASLAEEDNGRNTSEAQVRKKLRQIYSSQIGVKERSNANDGPQVEQYLRYAGLPKGNPWCAAFVCWAMGKAGIKNPRSGWSPALFPDKKVIWSRKLTVNAPNSVPALKPQAGDVFGIFFPDKKRIAHCGFVDEWNSTWVITVEGNTDNASSREGDGVYRKRRLLSTIYKVANWVRK